MKWHKTLLPHYFQRNYKGELFEVVEQRIYDHIEYEEIEVNEQGISRKYFESSKKREDGRRNK